MIDRTQRATLEGTVVVLMWTFAAWLGLTYVFSFSQATVRHSAHLAILMMDALIGAQLFTRWRERDPRNAVPKWRGTTQTVCRVAALAALAGTVWLHGEYAWARYRGAETVSVGTLESLKSWLIAAQLACVVFIAAAAWLRRSRDVDYRLFQRDDALVLSIVIVPLANYFGHNVASFSAATTAEYFAFFLAWPAAALLAVRLLETSLHAADVAAPVVAGLAFVSYSMPAVAGFLERPAEALLPVKVAMGILVPSLLLAGHVVGGQAMARGIAFLAAVSIAGSAIQATINSETTAPSAASARGGPAPVSSALAQLLSASPLRHHHGVYLLIYDGYAAPSMLRQYGFDPAPAMGYLTDQGFRLYETAHSLFLTSRLSMSSLLDMRAAAATNVGGHTTATTFFKSQGYRTHVVANSYLLEGSAPFAPDIVFPPWHDRSGLSALYRGIGGGEFKSEIVFQDTEHEEWVRQKRGILTTPSSQPRMLYAHSGYPGHSQNSGRCLDGETVQYGARLAAANDEMRDDVESILRADPDAIIIVAGDHGPYLTGDCLYMRTYNPSELTADHLADRYGTLLAIRWPDDVDHDDDQVAVIQDVFFAVAAHLLDTPEVWRHRIPATTSGYGGIPHGAVENGVVLVGRDTGAPLLPR